MPLLSAKSSRPSKAAPTVSRLGAAAPSFSRFSPEVQETPLNDDAFAALDTLRRREAANSVNSLDATLQRAAQLLENVVGEVNDRACEERLRRSNILEKLKTKGEEEDVEKRQQYEDFQQRVEGVNKTLDISARKVVDDRTWAAGVPNSIKHVIEKSRDIQMRNYRGSNEDGAADVEEELPAPLRLEPFENATALLKAAQSTAESEWNARTLTERYAQNETYAGFYKMKWDAQHSVEDPPPLPHHSVWFASEEGRSARRSRSDQDDEFMHDADDTEIQIQSENISCKCPLTLLYFEEPVTSTKCPHSFEKSAILEFIRASAERLPLTDEQMVELNAHYPPRSRGRPQAEAQLRAQNPRWAACPVCEMQLTERDVRDDPVLLRRTKRAIEAEQAENRAAAEDDGEEDSEDDYIVGTQRRKARKKEVMNIGSSPAAERRRTLIKPEGDVSVVPNSQSQAQSRRARGVTDIDDDEESDDENMTE